MEASIRTVDLEAHFLTPSYVDYLCNRSAFPRLEATLVDDQVQRSLRYDKTWAEPQESFLPALLDLGQTRLAHMDAAGVTTQVLSLGLPGCELLDPAEGAEPRAI